MLAVLDIGARAPSGMVRALSYQDLFAAHGFEVTFVSRQPLRVMDLLKSPPPLTARLLRRPLVSRTLTEWATDRSERRIIRQASRFDVVYLSKVMSYQFVRALRSATRARIVLDFGDAIWLNLQSADEFGELLSLVDAITTDNTVTAEYIRQYVPNCVVVPDAPQVEKFDERRGDSDRGRHDLVTLGWIGSRGTTYNLYVVWEALEELFRVHPNLHLRLVGTGRKRVLIPPFERVRFSVRESYGQAEMIEEVLGMDIGLFPLQNVEKCRVRGVLKATVYMSGEAAVVASPVGQVGDLIQDGVNGMLARSTGEWIEKLNTLIVDSKLRRRIALAGLDTVRAGFTLEQSFLRLKQVLLGDRMDED